MRNSEIKVAIAEAKKKLAGELEEHLKYKEAINIWEELKIHKEAKRIRSKIKEEGKVKVDQTVIHGDYVDDRDTIIKDSVVSRSNISSGGSSRMQELKELKEMLSEGLIDKDDFKEMKKEIMGK
jgi:chromatin segregation and condensation protein Rec8/ScpA/Scc1 (kleisin family)